ncbi:MAG: hypothetical protein ACR2MB_13830 [Acidimicrobiales bacterium]
MENHDVLTFTPVDHPDERVRRLGFDLSGSYFEQCWGPMLGPTATLLLRRMPTLWEEQTPAVISRGEFGRSLGVGPGKGTRSVLSHTLDRVVRFGFARWHGFEPSLDVAVHVPVLKAHHVERLPQVTQQAHERLLGVAVQQLADTHETAPKVAAITARLDRLEGRPSVRPERSIAPTQALGR